jgi:hypothetical protein
MIKFQCECGRKIAAPDQWLGKRVKCPQCGRPVLVQESPAIAPVIKPEPVVVPPPAVEHEHGFESDSASESASGPYSESESHGGSQSEVESEGHTDRDLSEDHGFDLNSARASSHPDSPFAHAPDREDYSGPAAEPEMRFFVPPAAAIQSARPMVIPTPAQQDYYENEESWGRRPRNFGIAALILGLVGAGIFFIPTISDFSISQYSIEVAGVGALLALIGLITSLRQDKAGISWPVVALFICVVAGGLHWLMPLITGETVAPIRPASKPQVADNSEAALEKQRRLYLSVDSVRVAKSGLASDVEYKLTNRGPKPIAGISGSLQVYDSEHKPVGGLTLSFDFTKSPLAVGASVTGKSTWSMDPRVLDAMNDAHSIFDYRAEWVDFGNGTAEHFYH